LKSWKQIKAKKSPFWVNGDFPDWGNVAPVYQQKKSYEKSRHFSQNASVGWRSRCASATGDELSGSRQKRFG
jgi:hypothetical protein